MKDTKTSIDTLTWPSFRLHLALQRLARDLDPVADQSAPPEWVPEHDPDDDGIMGEWMAAAAFNMGVEIASVKFFYSEIRNMLQCAGPALIRIPGKSPRFLAVLKGGKRKVSVVAPGLHVERIPADAIVTALTRDIENKSSENLDKILTEAGVSKDRRNSAKRAVLEEQLAGSEFGGCWFLRNSPGSNFWGQIRRARLPRLFTTIALSQFLMQIFVILSWWIIGREALHDHMDRAPMWAWALLILMIVPCNMLGVWAGNLLALGTDRLFKQRLLHGILHLKPDEIRHQGAGRFLSVVMEAESLGSAALGGGLTSVMAVIGMFMAWAVLSAGAGGSWLVLLFLCWAGFVAWLCLRYWRNAQKWIQTYRHMTNDMVERMVGYRTRLVQEKISRMHDEEAEILQGYVTDSKRLDTIGIIINGVVERGWFILGLAGIAPAFLAASGPTVGVAVSVGGILLASQSLHQLVAGVTTILGDLVAWKQVGYLFEAATRSRGVNRHSDILPATLEKLAASGNHPVIAAKDLTFRYRKGGRTILHINELQINPRERILLEGPSGGGKSTLAMLLTGMHTPECGKLMLWGADRREVRDDVWRRMVVTVPQFHENHVLTEPFSFNLLMGRNWPPMPEDMADASEICNELGLTDLLERMPAGFMQMVGEGGWRLSHGELSRLYIARALLQQPDIIIFDESFAALDPENMTVAAECVLDRSSTVVVIAHP